MVTFVVPILVDLFAAEKGVFYKYVVFSRRMEEVGHPYEYLHGAPNVSGLTNRALKVPRNKCIPGGQFSANCMVMHIN